MTADAAGALLPAARRPRQDGRAAGSAADGWRGALRGAVRRSGPVLPAVAVVALVAVPADRKSVV